MTNLDRKLQAGALLARRVEGDALVLADAVLLQALSGSRPLTHGERAALQASPLTLRRMRHLAAAVRTPHVRSQPVSWSGSAGLLRAADSGAPLEVLRTDDRMWRLHFVDQRGIAGVVVQLDLDAPGAAQLLASRATIAVRDGAGSVIVQGSLDADGECEGPWPFAASPAVHFQRHGARFDVQPIATPVPPST
ncbi:hypothetical protein [Massilia sp. MP_M2]|uniref:hypothetical protein n=1 Tax=Massilia sp. MP_M2 TaxID=3071713 RepID=UPI00319DECB7